MSPANRRPTLHPSLRRALPLLLSLLLPAACAEESSPAGAHDPPADGGPTDGAPADASAAADANPADLAPADLSAADAAPADLSAADAAPPDASAPDASAPDATPVDGGGPAGCAADPATVLRLHYRNPALAASYAQLWLWTWGAWTPEKDVPACGTDAYGAIFELPRAAFAPGVTMGYKVKRGPGTTGPWYESDRAWTEGTDCWEAWVTAADPAAYCDPADADRPRLTAVYWDSPTELNVELSRELPGLGEAARWTLAPAVAVIAAEAHLNRVKLTTAPLDIQTGYVLSLATDDGPVHNGLFPRRVLDPYVTDLPLGATIDPAGDTVFRLFAPRATSVVLHTSASPVGGAEQTLSLTRDPATGVYSGTLAGNRHGLYYWYTVDGPTGPGEHFDPTRPLNDPYALLALSSVGGLAGRGMVFDPARLGAVVPLATRPTLSSLVAWEVHVRDLAGAPSSGLDAADPAWRRYGSLTRRGLTGPAGPDASPVTTGLDHLLELGVNAVQLLPVQEFPAPPDRFNWGYFTANFFSPEGMYAAADDGEAKALELKAAIDGLHEAGLAVVLDIVLNHTAEGTELAPALNFKGIDSKYYYRQDPGTFSYRNGSGVGNDLATERPMVRRFLIDVLRAWVQWYGVDGFRFDLAGLFDLATVRAIAAAFPDRLLYGEPWASSGAYWGKGQTNDIDPFAVFDDDFRNALKGSPEGEDGGFIQGRGASAAVRTALTGSSVGVDGAGAWADAPTDGIRYLDAHDNLTLADKLEVGMAGLTPADKEARVQLALAATLTAPGPVMLHAGVEFLRSKPYLGAPDGRPLADADSEARFDANSYASSDETNNLNWQDKADHLGVVRFTQGLLALRASALGQACRPSGAVPAGYFAWHLAAGNPAALGYTLNVDRSSGPRRMRVLLNPGLVEASFDVAFPAAEGWRLLADGVRFDPQGLDEPPAEIGPLVVEPLGLRILVDGY